MEKLKYGIINKGMIHSERGNTKALEGVTRESRNYARYCVELCPQRLAFIQNEKEFQRSNKENEFAFLASRIPHSKMVPIDLTLHDQAQIYNRKQSYLNDKKWDSGLSYMEIHSLVVNILNPNLLKHKSLALTHFPNFKRVFIDSREATMAIKIHQTVLTSPNPSEIVCVIGAYHFHRVKKLLNEFTNSEDLRNYHFL